MVLEEKKYEEGCSEEIINLIKDRVTVEGGAVILFKEIPIQTPFSVNIIFDQINLLKDQVNDYIIVIDLTEAKMPDVKVRRRIGERFTMLSENFKHVAFFTGKNGIINTAIKFVMYGINLKSYSVHKTKKEALEAVFDGK